MSDALTPARSLVDIAGADEPDNLTVDDLREALTAMRGDGKMRWTTDVADVEHDNSYRASRAADTLLHYAANHDGTGELNLLLGDFLTDFMHLAQAAGQPWWHLTGTAQGNYDEELRGV